MFDGFEIRQRRINLGLSLRNLASMSEIDPSYLSRIENNLSNPHPVILENIFNILEENERVLNKVQRVKEAEVKYSHRDRRFDSLLQELNESLKFYNQRGEISLDETIGLLIKIDEIIKSDL